eukprot:gb/GEZN01008195.1/.p1 GENE.gb/GEZN01008195.1/~~gb/GEZN01008195.1/.p1  ORF type:complete len:286 (-),score=58.94 gb/GEZN01008195.1/:571-1428(-)
MSEERLNSALNLMRRMPPAQVENSLAGLIELAPDLQEDLLNNVDQPLKVEKDSKTGKQFILCDYNRDGDSYRSPWSNAYFPPIPDGEEGFLPGPKLREMETQANMLFDIYRKLYFEGGFSSVYFFETEEGDSGAFGSCWLIHKEVPQAKALKSGWWDSIHVFSVEETKTKGKFKYSLTTTVMVSMNLKEPGRTGDVDLSGNMTKQVTKEFALDKVKGHIQHMGAMLEEMELTIRNAIEGIYIQKTREVINGMRSASGEKDQLWAGIAQNLSQTVKDHALKRAKMG